MPCTFSPRPIVSVTAVNERETGFAYNSDDGRELRTKLKRMAGDDVKWLLVAAGALDNAPEMTKKLILEAADDDEARRMVRELIKLAVGATAGVSSAGDDGRLYNEVTLYVLDAEMQGYDTLQKRRTTRKQLRAIWDKSGYIYVARVDTKPAQLLTLKTRPDSTDVDNIDLEDGIQLAVVVHQLLPPMQLLQNKVTENTNQVQELRGFKDHMVDAQENAATAWALEQIKAQPGAQILCIKEVAKAVELDGAACSDVSVVIVECKQSFRYPDLEDYVAKLEKLKKLIELGAANTELLQGKELRAYAMAGSWSGSTDEQAAMVLLMNEHHIQPVMPDGTGYSISWACNPHQPASSTAAETAACAQRFLETRRGEKSAQPAKLR